MSSDANLKVLIVDDHANWRSLLAQLLNKEFKVVVAESYEEACVLLSKQHPAFHVLVADLRLDDRDTADENGLALAEELKRSGADTKVIIVTGYATFGSMEKAYQGLQVYGYLLKNPGKGEVFDHRKFVQFVWNAASLVEKNRQRFVFVLMPFADEYRSLYENVIKATVERRGFACKRADDFFQSMPIMDDIRAGVRNAVLNIADFSGRNANVFYEVGLAHAAQRPTLLITQNIDDVPLSLRHLRHVVYADEPGAAKLARGLELAIEEFSNSGYSSTPIFDLTDVQEDERACLVLTDYRNSDSKKAYETIIQPTVDHENLSCSRIADVFSTDSVFHELAKSISRASVIIADLSERDPDVFYLTGLAHGLRKKVILFAQNESDIPFDLRERSYLKYSVKTFRDGENGKEKLRVLLKGVMHNCSSSVRDGILPTGQTPSDPRQNSRPVDCDRLAPNIQELVGKDQLLVALIEIESISSLTSDVADLKRRLHEAEENYRRNLITLDVYSTKRSSIGHAILELVGRVCPP